MSDELDTPVEVTQAQMINDRRNAFRSMVDAMKINNKPVWIGVDWSRGSGYCRGDVISTHSNVIEVRFKHLELNKG